MVGNPLQCELTRGEGDPYVGMAISDAGIDLIVYGMATQHFDILHPVLGTLAEAMDPMGLDDYIRFNNLDIEDGKISVIRDTLALPTTWMKEHVTDRLDYVRQEDGLTRMNVTLPEFYWFTVAVELMTPLFKPDSIQYDFLARLVDKATVLFTDAELMAGWAGGEYAEGGTDG